MNSLTRRILSSKYKLISCSKKYFAAEAKPKKVRKSIYNTNVTYTSLKISNLRLYDINILGKIFYYYQRLGQTKINFTDQNIDSFNKPNLFQIRLIFKNPLSEPYKEHFSGLS